MAKIRFSEVEQSHTYQIRLPQAVKRPLDLGNMYGKLMGRWMKLLKPCQG
jgi:hypothetical protein